MFPRHFYSAVVCLLFGAVSGAALAAPVQYAFTANAGLFSFDRTLLEDVTGLTAAPGPSGVGWLVPGSAHGTFTYDAAGGLDFVNTDPMTGATTTFFNATVSTTASLVVDGVTLGTLSGTDGWTIVNDDPGGADFFNVAMTNAAGTWSAFSVGAYDVVAGGAIWTEGDFLAEEALLGMLPPPPNFEFAFYRFGFMGGDLPPQGDGILALGLEVTAVPVPAGIWLLGSALLVLGRLGRRRAFGAAAALLAASSANAVPVQWTLQDVLLDDGTSVAGSFVFDRDTFQTTNIDITTQDGPVYVGRHYGACNVANMVTSCGPVGIRVFEQALPDLTDEWVFSLWTDGEMTNVGGTLILRTDFGGESVCLDADCNPSSPRRGIVEGSIVGQVVPVPGAVWLFGSALGAVAWLRRRKS